MSEVVIYTVEPGRTILRNGKPFVQIARVEGTSPAHADRVTHTVAYLLNLCEQVVAVAKNLE